MPAGLRPFHETTTRVLQTLLHVFCMLYSMNDDPQVRRSGCKTGEPRWRKGSVCGSRLGRLAENAEIRKWLRGDPSSRWLLALKDLAANSGSDNHTRQKCKFCVIFKELGFLMGPY